MHSQTLKRQGGDLSFSSDDNDYADVTWCNKKSRYLYTYDLKSPDLFSTSDSESIYSDQSKETVLLADHGDSESETSCGSDFNDCDSQNSSQSDNSELEVKTKHVTLFSGNGYSPDDTDSQVATSKTNLVTPCFFKLCMRCHRANDNPFFQYCCDCFRFRKQLSESKPGPKPKGIKLLNIATNSVKTTKSLKHYPESSTSSSQESGSFGISGLCLSQESATDTFDNDRNLCNVCCLKPKNGIFNHNKTAHVYCCYSCSKKIWNKTGKCPICNLKIRYVTKAVIVNM